ncbi:hypothetical protein F2Q69_00032729 [Brassica cretica]|uniref:Uncharacterized protein n=1 Tax=Brassica cretica TaxID=69181 RepID=A0A8S9SDH5_BRACR|nr:hypothetical protein F2Q69_00032729 [Brassica cretica]
MDLDGDDDGSTMDPDGSTMDLDQRQRWISTKTRHRSWMKTTTARLDKDVDG